MLWFIGSVICLLTGYFFYGRVVERIFGVNASRKTPAWSERDGVDYVPMSRARVFLVQLLNIAGIGPVFGPIMGALYGPAAMLWILVGCIFAGGVHDYFSGMLSVRHKGRSVPALAGLYLGPWARHLIDVFALILLLLVGVVFILAPATLLEHLTGYSASIFVVLIFGYCFLATIVPVDKILGRLYPAFGLLLLIMSLAMVLALCLSADHRVLPDVTAADFFKDLSTDSLPLWPALFITIACGAISGFHATQSPLMARCIENEKEGRFVFYGAMVGEGLIALVWCLVALSCFGGVAGLREVMQGSPANVVYTAAQQLLGSLGGAMAVLGVVILPITSGDTAFRSARLILAEFFRLATDTAVPSPAAGRAPFSGGRCPVSGRFWCGLALLWCRQPGHRSRHAVDGLLLPAQQRGTGALADNCARHLHDIRCLHFPAGLGHRWHGTARTGGHSGIRCGQSWIGCHLDPDQKTSTYNP